MNSYEIRGEHTVLFIKRKNGQIIEVKIDTEDLPLLVEKGTNWTLIWNEFIEGFYVQGHKRIGVNRKTKIYLHRFLTGAPKGVLVDHINCDSLDNRKSNLRFATQSENQQNRKGADKRSKTGIRGVSWHKQNSKWQVHVAINGKRIYCGCFEKIEDAESAAIEARKKYHPYSA